MSKIELKKYLAGLTKRQLQEQVVDLYDRFKEVKTFYDFAFNPKEEKLIQAAKEKIGKEYFPLSRRKPKMRRSVAQKLIKHFHQLQLDPQLLLDLMLFNIETAQSFAAEKPIKQESFYVSMLKSFVEAIDFSISHGIRQYENHRIERISELAATLEWPNSEAFEFATVS